MESTPLRLKGLQHARHPQATQQVAHGLLGACAWAGSLRRLRMQPASNQATGKCVREGRGMSANAGRQRAQLAILTFS